MSNSNASLKLSVAHLLANLAMPDAGRTQLEERIAELVESEVERERLRCVAQCRRRAELWRKTAASSPLAGALEEARGRGNEAQYLAELLEFGSEIPAHSNS